MSDLLRWSKVEDEAGRAPVLPAPRLLSELPKAQGLPLALRACLIMDEVVADGLASLPRRVAAAGICSVALRSVKRMEMSMRVDRLSSVSLSLACISLSARPNDGMDSE